MSEISAADDLARQLIASTSNPRRKASIEAVRDALVKLTGRRESISVAAVARLTEKMPGGPREQSIRNDPNGLKRLIELALLGQPPSTRSTSRNPDNVFDVGDFAGIPDPVLRSRCQGMAEQVRLLERENARLRAAMKRLQALHHLDEMGASGDLTQANPSTVLTEGERQAMSQFLEQLAHEGFAVDAGSGELLSRSGRTVAPPAFIAGLRKLCSTD